MPEKVQRVLLLRRANLSTQARIAIMTLAGNSLSFSDVRKACKRYAGEFLRDPKEHDVHGSHSLCLTGKRSTCQVRGTRRRHRRRPVAALARESDTDLEETDVKEIQLAYQESRQLRGEQRANRGCRPVTRRSGGGNHIELISRTRCRLCREKGHWARECPIRGREVPRDGEEVITSFFVYFGGDHSTPGYIGKGVVDTGCSRLLIGQSTLEKWGLSTRRIQLAKAMTFRFGNDETLETKTLAILPVGIAGVNGVLRVHVVTVGAPLLLSKW